MKVIIKKTAKTAAGESKSEKAEKVAKIAKAPKSEKPAKASKASKAEKESAGFEIAPTADPKAMAERLTAKIEDESKGHFAMRLILAGKSNEEVMAKARTKFGEKKVPRYLATWFRRYLVKKGVLTAEKAAKTA